MNVEPFLQNAVQSHPHPLLFAVLSGAHLYGFPSEDSDFDVRGVHVLPATEVVGLRTGSETVQSSRDREGHLIDLVTALLSTQPSEPTQRLLQ